MWRNTKGTFGLIILLAGVILLAACAPKPPSTRMPVEQTIETLYRNLHQANTALAESAARYCTAPNQSALVSVQAALIEAMTRWFEADAVQFGPASEDNLRWRFVFWPDKRDSVARTVERLLAPSASPQEALAGPGNALGKGYPALEYLLFEPSNQAKLVAQSRHCQYLAVASQLLADESARLVSAWQQADAAAITQRDTLVRSLAAASRQLEQRLRFPFDHFAKPNPYLAEARRSGAGFATLRATLVGMRQLYHSGLSAQLAEDNPALHRAIRHALSRAIRLTREADLPFQQQVVADNASTVLIPLVIEVVALKTLLNRELPAHWNITLGFNAEDGD